MGVYIKGMEMPKSCHKCFIKQGSCPAIRKRIQVLPKNNHILVPYNYRYDDCPLVEVLPHGDLIDRDELMKTLEITEECEKCKSHVGVHCTRVYFVGACEAICDAPTIIEAEEWKP